MKCIKFVAVALVAAAIAASVAGCGGIGALGCPPLPGNAEPPSSENPRVTSVTAEPAAHTTSAVELTSGVAASGVDGKDADDAFAASMAEFSIELFKATILAEENSLISPLSVMLALAMAANGADGETLAQMETLLGGTIPLAELNAYLYSYANGLPNEAKSELLIANSIWFRDDRGRLRVDEGFLQRNADYFGAMAYKAAFDEQTVADINNWVDENTNGMIDKILDSINETHNMYLINAVMFDAEWQNVYFKENIHEGIFTDIAGTEQRVDFMHSTEGAYLDGGMATGFIKPYANGGYSFAALLPNEDVTLEEYIESLSGERFQNTMQSSQRATVFASMPKFEYEYEIMMNDALAALGMSDAFDVDKADFSRMADSSAGNIFISLVLHKTFISVDELGTKAGAVTMVAMDDGGAPMDTITVRLDRPFVFAIIDNATSLPIFMGTLVTV